MYLTPNKLNWGKCPECKVIINTNSDFPIDIIGNPYFTRVKCPSCKKEIYAKMKIEHTYILEKINLENSYN